MALGEGGPTRRGWASRVAVLVVVAVVVAVVFGAVPGLLAEQPDRAAAVSHSEYDVADLSVTRLPAEGVIPVDTGGEGTIVIDRSHANRFTATDIDPLYEALTRAGYDVAFHDRGPLAPALADATALVVIDPGNSYDTEDTETLRAYTEAGGRLLVLAEPTRVSVTSGIGGVATSERRSRLSTLAAEFDVAISIGYVYHQSAHDGNYKSPLATPVGPAAAAGSDVALYTPAAVTSIRDGTVVLRTRGGSRLSDSDEIRRYPVAVQTGNALIVGDSTFVQLGRYNVVDNEGFLGYVIAFLGEGSPPGEGFENGDAVDGGDGSGDEMTSTPTPPPTGTPGG